MKLPPREASTRSLAPVFFTVAPVSSVRLPLVMISTAPATPLKSPLTVRPPALSRTFKLPPMAPTAPSPVSVPMVLFALLTSTSPAKPPAVRDRVTVEAFTVPARFTVPTSVPPGAARLLLPSVSEPTVMTLSAAREIVPTEPSATLRVPA